MYDHSEITNHPYLQCFVVTRYLIKDNCDLSVFVCKKKYVDFASIESVFLTKRKQNKFSAVPRDRFEMTKSWNVSDWLANVVAIVCHLIFFVLGLWYPVPGEKTLYSYSFLSNKMRNGPDCLNLRAFCIFSDCNEFDVSWRLAVWISKSEL